MLAKIEKNTFPPEEINKGCIECIFANSIRNISNVSNI